jgi:hypothetical protein
MLFRSRLSDGQESPDKPVRQLFSMAFDEIIRPHIAKLDRRREALYVY